MNSLSIELESVKLKITARSAASPAQVYEAAIKYFINQLSPENRPLENAEVDVSTMVERRIRLKPNQ